MDTYFHILTSEGRGAIAVVRVWGRGVVEVVNRVFQPTRGKPIAGTMPGHLRLGRAGLGLGDEVVAVMLEGTTPIAEIQCHGGVAAVRSVVIALEAAGARPWMGSETVCNLGSAGDRIVFQALADLPHAPTLRTAEILLDQVQGAFGRELGRLRHDMQLGKEPLVRLDAMISRSAIGVRLLTGWKVVISGRPNVGKSRLFNALAGFARAIVDPTPGVTRDVVTFRTALGGWPIELADTAGIRETEDAIERIGVARTRREQLEADLSLLVLDRSEPLQAIDRELVATTTRALVVANKADLAPAWEPDTAFPGLSSVVTASAESGEGLDELIAAIVQRLVPDPPAPEAAVPFREDHLAALLRVRDCLLAADYEGAASELTAIEIETLE